MKYIGCYDDAEQEISAICEENDITECELVDAFLEILRSGEVDIKDWI